MGYSSLPKTRDEYIDGIQENVDFIANEARMNYSEIEFARWDYVTNHELKRLYEKIDNLANCALKFRYEISDMVDLSLERAVRSQT